MMRRARIDRVILGAGALCVALACGEAQTDDGSGGPSGVSGGSAGRGAESSGGSAGSDGATGGSGTGGAQTTSGFAGSGGAGEAGGGAGIGGSAGNGGGTGAAAGTGGTGGTEASALAMFVMFDRSGSMRECPDGDTTNTPFSCASTDGPNRWDNAALGVTTFLQDPALAGVGTALRFFPHGLPVAGCAIDLGAGCDPWACSQTLVPLMADPTVPLPKLTADAAPSDVHEAALVAAIAATYPPTMPELSTNTGGPTSAALAGAHMWAGAYQAAHLDEETIVMFVTDGVPSDGCQEQPEGVPLIAAEGLATNGVKTHVVGLGNATGDFVAFLDAVAVAGGTSAAVMVEDSATANDELHAALRAIILSLR